MNLGLAQTVSDDSNSHEAHHSSIDLDTQQLEVESHDTRDDDDGGNDDTAHAEESGVEAESNWSSAAVNVTYTEEEIEVAEVLVLLKFAIEAAALLVPLKSSDNGLD